MLPPFLMPTAREHSSCLEASRAAALAAHSAAGLAAAAGLREAARLLRSCEALARAATAALQSTTTSASPGPLGATAVAGQATHAPAAPAARRRKRNKKKKGGVNSEGLVVGAGGAPVAAPEPAPVASPFSPLAQAFVPSAATASVGALEMKPSRAPSPRLCASPMPPSSFSSPRSFATLLAAPAGDGGLLAGGIAVLGGLVSRPELAGSSVTLLSFDSATGRWAISLGTGETIRVKADFLSPAVFGPAPSGAAAKACGFTVLLLMFAFVPLDATVRFARR